MRYPIRFVFALLLAAALPFVALAQAVAPPGDDLGALLALVADAVKGGDWQGAVLVGVLVLVWVIRKVLVRIPKVAAFIATDGGGALLLILAGLPTLLLAAKAGGAALTLSLVGKSLVAVLGAGGTWGVARKLLRLVSPLIAKIPGVGPSLVGLVDALSGAKAKAEIAAAVAAAYKPISPAPDAAQAAAILGKPPVP